MKHENQKLKKLEQRWKKLQKKLLVLEVRNDCASEVWRPLALFAELAGDFEAVNAVGEVQVCVDFLEVAIEAVRTSQLTQLKHRDAAAFSVDGAWKADSLN